MNKRVTPEYISKLVNFGPELKIPWVFNPKERDMRNAQAMGSAAIYNILVDQKIALLADEVGMGKTIQALSICAALWKEKPDAKILILAPREEVARNWIAEYSSFIKRHYRINDNIVKSEFGDEPVNEMVYCHNLYSWVHHINLKWPKLLIGKTTSLSSIVSNRDIYKCLDDIGIYNKEIYGSKTADKNKEVCKILRKAMGLKTTPIFDLLIIDEAHYYRNISGGSLRVDSAKILFGEPNEVPLAKKVLLMTATPNHSSSEDIKSITSYFTDKFLDKSHLSILEKICIRRLRRLSKKGFTKYAYRKEIELPSDLEHDPLGELFFGLYHYQLVQRIENGKRNGNLKNAGIDKLRTYLEGTEFIPNEREDIVPSDNLSEDDENVEDNKKKDNVRGTDYRKGEDQDILLDLSKEFNEAFDKPPNHPKYEALIRQIKINGNEKKALIFVRRIPSVYEINKRIISEQDKLLWGKFRTLHHFKELEKYPGREKFVSILSSIPVGTQETDLDLDNTDETDDKLNNIKQVNKTERNYKIWPSEILDLFISKKEFKNNKTISISTPASNFRNRFDHSTTSPFALFFSPGPNYNEDQYKEFLLFKYQTGKKQIPNYYESGLVSRLDNFTDWKNQSSHFISRKKPIEGSEEVILKSIPTFFTMFWEKVKNEGVKMESILAKYNNYSVVEKEALCGFIEKGLLHGSDLVVDLFIAFLNSSELQGEQNSNKDALGTYILFCEKAKSIFDSDELLNQISNAILNFDIIYRKVFELYSEEELFNYTWSDFSYLKVYPYSAENKNNSILKSFNTPFYPKYLVATSVLQEGVNLQYFCDNIFHYGAAWTPGDNEQRNGRVDRMFGLIERNLEVNSKSTLNIYYPYLKNSVDEANISKFFKKKHVEEKLLDEGQGVDENNIIESTEDALEDWRTFLRTPVDEKYKEPYGVLQNTFIGLPKRIDKNAILNLDLFLDSIKESLGEVGKYDIQFSILGYSINNGFVADPFLPDADRLRRQPVIVELIHDGIGSGLFGKHVYVLKMRTPLQGNRRWKEVRDKIVFNNIRIPENVKLCLDNVSRAGNYWGIYLRTDLPLFIDIKKSNPLSKEEIIHSFVQLVEFSDKLEKLTFINQDLKKEEINLLGPEDKIVIDKNILTNNRGELKYPNWKKGDKCFYREEVLSLNSGNALTKEAWQFNHQYNYINFEEVKSKLTSKVFLYSEDSLEIEFDFLNDYIEVILKDIAWITK